MKFNIEKIKKHKFAGCSIIVILFIVLVIVAVNLFFNGSHHTIPANGLISDEKVEALNQDSLRKQLISYEFPCLIDTAKSVYMIPVSIKTLKKPEKSKLGLVSNEEVAAYETTSYRGRSSKSFYGEYVNLIIYNPLENKVISLFNERVLIGDVQAYYFKDDILLVFYTASKDTDGNGIIDLDDLRNLCIYSLNTETMRKISDKENQPNSYTFVRNSKDLLIEFQLSQYKKEQFSGEQIPRKIMKYAYDTQTLTDIVPEKIRNDMQKLVEGK